MKIREFIIRIIKDVRNNDLSDKNLIDKYVREYNAIIPQGGSIQYFKIIHAPEFEGLTAEELKKILYAEFNNSEFEVFEIDE